MDEIQTPQTNTPQTVPPKKRRVIYLIMLLGLVLIAGAIFAYQNKLIKPDNKQETVNNSEQNNKDQQKPEDLKTYMNVEYGFEFKYPQDWSVVNVPGGEELGTNDGTIFPAVFKGSIALKLTEIKKYADISEDVTVKHNGLEWRLIRLKDKVTGRESYRALYEKNNTIFEFTLVNNKTTDNLIQILSTFKFIGPHNYGYLLMTNSLGNSGSLFFHQANKQPDVLVAKYPFINTSKIEYQEGRLYYARSTFNDDISASDPDYQIKMGHMHQQVGYIDLTTQKNVVLADLRADPNSYGQEVRGEDFVVVDGYVYFLHCDLTKTGLNEYCKLKRLSVNGGTVEIYSDLLPVGSGFWNFNFYSRYSKRAVIAGPGAYPYGLYSFNLDTKELKLVGEQGVHLIKVEAQVNDVKLCGERPGGVYNYAVLGCFAQSSLPQVDIAKGIVRGKVTLGQFSSNKKPAVYSSDHQQFIYEANIIDGKYAFELPVGNYLIDFRNPDGRYDNNSKLVTIEANKEIVVDFNIP